MLNLLWSCSLEEDYRNKERTGVLMYIACPFFSHRFVQDWFIDFFSGNDALAGFSFHTLAWRGNWEGMAHKMGTMIQLLHIENQTHL